MLSGKPIHLSGFRIVDAKRFLELPEAVVLDWHKKGWRGWFTPIWCPWRAGTSYSSARVMQVRR
jgi:hypothetical protein